MIVYLGMPRCASSWIYDHFDSGVKETHYLYKNPVKVEEYCRSHVLDFSTNNWSIDSDVIKELDPYVSDYLLIVRDPIELAVSYKSLFNTEQSLDDFVTTMIVNKLLCYGDIIQRWYNLVDPAKILIYSYDSIVADNNQFITQLSNKLNLPLITPLNINKTNASTVKKYEAISQENLELLAQQTAKFKQITKVPIDITINNKL